MFVAFKTYLEFCREFMRLIWGHFTEEDEIKIEIDNEFKSKDANGTLAALVRSLSQSFVSGYMMTVGLKNDDPNAGIEEGKI